MFLSDFHIGENYGAVSRVRPERKRNDYDSLDVNVFYHKKVYDLMDTLKTICNNQGTNIKYLILVGDIFDIAVHEESDAFNLATEFFNHKINDTINSFISYFDEIIYLPGNHDHHMWRLLQEKHYLSDQISQNNPALPFPQQTISVLDLNTGGIIDSSNKHIPYQNNLISYLIGQNQKPVHIAYPNLYIKYFESDSDRKNSEKGICVTHGHFFEPNWNKDDNLVPYFSKINADKEYFKNIEQKNFPFTEFSDYGMAQINDSLAQNLTDGNYKSVTINRRNGQPVPLALYLNETYPAFFPLDTNTSHPTDIDKLDTFRLQVMPYLNNTREQMKIYHMSFDKLVYGHTHVPCFNENYSYYNSDSTRQYSLTVSNTGGWVNIDTDTTKEIYKTPNPMFLFRNGELKQVFK